jgi:hypothetical protein
MLNSAIQTNSYQSNLNSAVSEAVTGAKPDLITNDQMAERSKVTRKSSDNYSVTLNMESVNKAIDDKVAEYFNQFPNGGSDHDLAKFIEEVRLSGR